MLRPWTGLSKLFKGHKQTRILNYFWRAWLAHVVERRILVREIKGLNPRLDQHSGSQNNWRECAAIAMTSANGEKFKSSRITMRNYKCRLESLLNLLPALPSPAKKKKKGERPQVSINLTGKTIGLIVFFLSLLSFKLWPGKLQRWHPPYVNWFNFKLDTADVNQIKLIFFSLFLSCLLLGIKG